jgi:hypothetical protein
MAVWGPDGLDERTALAEEILRLARETGDREMELDGHASRAASSLESGDIQAVLADIAAHARLAEELPMAIHRWAATTMRALRALLSGSFEEAERLANDALSLQPGRPNVVCTHLVQVALRRWEQGRLGELRSELQGVVDSSPGPRSQGHGWRSPTPKLVTVMARAGGCGRWPNSSPSGLEMAFGCLPWHWPRCCPRT